MVDGSDKAINSTTFFEIKVRFVDGDCTRRYSYRLEDLGSGSMHEQSGPPVDHEHIDLEPAANGHESLEHKKIRMRQKTGVFDTDLTASAEGEEELESPAEFVSAAELPTPGDVQPEPGGEVRVDSFSVPVVLADGLEETEPRALGPCCRQEAEVGLFRGLCP